MLKNYLLALLFSFSGCYTIIKQPSLIKQDENKKIALPGSYFIEGIVQHRRSWGIIGEFYNGPGFLLVNYNWLSDKPRNIPSTIYLSGIDSSYIGKHIAIEGSYTFREKNPKKFTINAVKVFVLDE